jgi:hypothetical protein
MFSTIHQQQKQQNPHAVAFTKSMASNGGRGGKQKKSGIRLI